MLADIKKCFVSHYIVNCVCFGGFTELKLPEEVTYYQLVGKNKVLPNIKILRMSKSECN
jgi:hypothetical protein